MHREKPYPPNTTIPASTKTRSFEIFNNVLLHPSTPFSFFICHFIKLPCCIQQQKNLISEMISLIMQINNPLSIVNENMMKLNHGI